MNKEQYTIRDEDKPLIQKLQATTLLAKVHYKAIYDELLRIYKLPENQALSTEEWEAFVLEQREKVGFTKALGNYNSARMALCEACIKALPISQEEKEEMIQNIHADRMIKRNGKYIMVLDEMTRLSLSLDVGPFLIEVRE